MDKKKKTIIVSSESPNLYTSKRLIEEAKKLKYPTKWINPYQTLLVPIETNIQNKNLYFHRTTGIRYDDFDLLVSKHHELEGFIVTNPLSTLSAFRDKSLQSLFFTKHKLPQITTVSYRGPLTLPHWGLISSLSETQKFIIKMDRGNQGIGVNLVDGLQSLKSLLETFFAIKDQRFVIQPFLEHKKEWRVFVIKNEIVAIIERTLGNEDFRGNSKRSSGKIIKKIDKEIENEILRGAQLSGLDYCGIDIVSHQNQFYFLEFNPIPGFEQIEALSKINIARELLLKIV